MIVIAHENLSKVKAEIAPLLEEHWELVALNKETIKLNPDWEEYARLDSTGYLRIFTARKDGELIGYFVLVINRSLHYKDHYFATNDVIFVKPDKRAGAVGQKLLTFAEEYCTENGVSLLTVNTKTHIPFDSLLLFNKFDLAERVYTKLLGS